MEEAKAAVESLCARGMAFTTDDVWKKMTLVNIQTADNRAMGAVMRQAALDGLIRNTYRTKKSTRPVCNRRPITIWQPIRSM
jgi:hypothetical protein